MIDTSLGIVQAFVFNVVARMGEGLTADVANMRGRIIVGHVSNLKTANLKKGSIATLANAWQFARLRELTHLQSVDVQEPLLARFAVGRKEFVASLVSLNLERVNVLHPKIIHGR